MKKIFWIVSVLGSLWAFSGHAQVARRGQCGVNMSCSVKSISYTQASGSNAIDIVSGAKFCLNGSTCTAYITYNGGIGTIEIVTPTTAGIRVGGSGGTQYITALILGSSASTGNVGIALNNTGARMDYGGGSLDYMDSDGTYVGSPGGFRLKTTGSLPTCDVNARGALWTVQGGAGVADYTAQCLKSTLNAYSWVTVVTAL